MRFPAQTFACSLALAIVLSASPVILAQQPQVDHAQLTTQSVDHGLSAALDGLRRQNAPLWAGYTIPVSDKFSSGWRSNGV